MTSEQLLHLAGLGLLFILSAGFACAETALLSFDRLRLSYLLQKKDRRAEQLDRLLRHPDQVLGTLLVGNNIINIAISVFSTTLFVELFGPERGELFTIIILTPFLLIFAEVAPKTVAARASEPISFAALPLIRPVMLLLLPVVWVIGGVSRFLATFFVGTASRPIISEEEIRTLINVGEESGGVPQEQQQMLHGVFDLGQMQVRQVMIPRTEIVGIEAKSSFAEVLTLIQSSLHSRFPVYEGSFDSVIGIIHAKDILRCLDRPESFDLRGMVRPPLFVPESNRIETLLQSFRRERVHLAVVVDEYGGVEGIITLEDVIEQIVGDIGDEYDEEEIPFREIAPNRFIFDGGETVRTVNRRFGLDLSEEHVTTMAGFLLRQFGAIPVAGESCTVGKVTFTVLKVAERRIEEIEMALREEDQAEDD